MRVFQRANKICEQCGAGFTVPNYRREKARFCSASCRSASVAEQHFNKGPKPWAAKNLDGHRHKSGSQFKAGVSPWNLGLKGIHLSEKSEFKKGRASLKKAGVGAETVRKTKAGILRAFVKVAEPNVWLERARVVWEATNGPLPPGCVVHHKDRNPLNDSLDNLQAMTRAEHIEEHRGEFKT